MIVMKVVEWTEEYHYQGDAIKIIILNHQYLLTPINFMLDSI